MKKTSCKPSKLKLKNTMRDTQKVPNEKLNYFDKKIINRIEQQRSYDRQHRHNIFFKRGDYAQKENILLGARVGKK